MTFTFAWPRTLSFRDCKRARLPMRDLLEGKPYPTWSVCAEIHLQSALIWVSRSYVPRPLGDWESVSALVRGGTFRSNCTESLDLGRTVKIVITHGEPSSLAPE